MEKKIMLGLIFLLLLSFSFASISNYNVPSEVPLNLEVTATGKSLDTNSVANTNQICSFYFLEAETGYLVDRATDQYTDQTGRFAMPKFKLTEPDFIRGQNYTLKTICGENETDANFLVIQRQDAVDIFGTRIFPQAIGLDLKYWTNADYIYALMYGLVFLGIVIFMFKKMFFK
jgi:hypothetical protein